MGDETRERVRAPESCVVCAISLEELERVWLLQVGKGRLTLEEARKLWATWKKGPKVVADQAAAGDDVLLAMRLVGDLGAVSARVYYKRYGGKLHVIFKGYAGTRKILNGTRYLATNPKVVQMGVGRAGAVSRVRGGAVLTLVLVSGYRIVDYVLSDEQTLTGLIGHLATDVVKVAASAACASVLAGLAAATPVVACFAVGPLLVAIAAGVTAGIALDYLDSKYRVTEQLVEAMEAAVQRAQNGLQSRVDSWEDTVARAARDALDVVVEAAIREAQEFVLRRLRNFVWLPVASAY